MARQKNTPKHPFRAKQFALRIIGNWGGSFFGPLVGGNVANSLFDVELSFENTLIIALVASIFQTGLVLSREAKYYGEKK